VILELGIAIGKLGRDKILVLRKSEIEEPSDILGMIYESFNDHVSEIKDKIRKSLVKADIKIQENNN
jgi:predicted nucleotide-binding protein